MPSADFCPTRPQSPTAAPPFGQALLTGTLPEIPLFNAGSAANYCTLYQKDCSSGETIVIDKWAVPVFHP